MKTSRPNNPDKGPRERLRISRIPAGPNLGGRGYMLIEVLVYMGILLILLGLGYAALYDSMENSIALRRNADDIVKALQAGESWRADVRAATSVRSETNAQGLLLLLRGPSGEVDYRFATNTVFRRLGGNAWRDVVSHVKATSFVFDPRLKMPVWRWELELLPSTTRFTHIRPLFTFLSVPFAKPRK